MDLLETLQVLLYGFVAVVVAFLIGYLLDPFKRARILRVVTSRNYGVVAIRGKGGQTTYKVHDFNKPTCEYGKGDNKRSYAIIEESGEKVYVDHAGTVPVIYFNIDDANPATLLRGSEKKILPENIESIIMLVKARSEAKAQLSLKTMKILLIICLALSAICLLVAFLTYNEVGSTKGAINSIARVISNYTPQPGVLEGGFTFK